MHDSRFAGDDHQEAPYFFLSYAPVKACGDSGGHNRARTDKHVTEFLTDLNKEVARAAGHPVSTAVVHHTPDGERTARALHRCHSFVPLISRRYFTDAYCGRQWYAFTHRARRGVLVPVVWTPVAVPAPPVAVNLDLPLPEGTVTPLPVDAMARDRYARDGLYGLLQDLDNRESYGQCARRIAQCVVQAARTTPDPGPDDTTCPDLADLPDSFATSSRHSLGITVLAPDIHHLPPGCRDTHYGPEPRDWQPFDERLGTPLAEHAAMLAHALGYAPEIRTFDQAEPVFLGRQEAANAWVLLLDPWVLHDRRAVERLKAFDALDLPWVTVLIPVSDDPQTARARSELNGLLRTSLPRRLISGRAMRHAAVAGVERLEAFDSRFVELVDSAAQQYLNRVPSPSATGCSSGPQPADSAGDQEARP
ncbi:FxsC protein [Streptomyces sp. NPDC127197]|uniref:FxsC protein n=1 Tax=Streptomyces sp. NPDC127197 TaxID=3345388 RepID=UPI0036277C9C